MENNIFKTIAIAKGLKWDEEKQESEEFKLNGYVHKITNTGLMYIDGRILYSDLQFNVCINAEIVKTPFVPKMGENYWIYRANTRLLSKIDKATWDGRDFDWMCLYLGNVFRNKEDVTEAEKERLTKIFDRIKQGERYYEK